MIGEIVLDDKKYAAVRLDCKFDLKDFDLSLPAAKPKVSHANK